MRMLEKMTQQQINKYYNNSDNPLTSRRSDGGKNRSFSTPF